VITTSQYWLPLWRFSPSSATRPSRPILGISFGCLAGVVAVCFVVLSTNRGERLDPRTDWCALDIVYAISYVKLLITLIKYTPQIVTNYHNRSTKGWSIAQILLDMNGGVLSIAQQSIDSYLQHDWSGITGNPVKFALGNLSILFDIIFITQHYVLYREKDEKSPEQDSLLGRDDIESRRLD
jgi:cystinosin